MARGIFLTTECDAVCVNWGEFAGSCQLLLWDGLGSSEQLHCATLWVGLVLSLPFALFLLLVVFYFILLQLLSCSNLNPLVLLFPDSPPQPTGAEVSEGLSSI